MHVHLSSWGIRLNTDLHTHRCSYFVRAWSLASDKTAQFLQAGLGLNCLSQVLISHEPVNRNLLKPVKIPILEYKKKMAPGSLT